MSDNADRKSDKKHLSVEIERNGKIDQKLSRANKSKSRLVREALRDYMLPAEDLDVEELIKQNLEAARSAIDVDVKTPGEWEEELQAIDDEIEDKKADLQAVSSESGDLKFEVAIGQRDKSELEDYREEEDQITEEIQELGDRREQLEPILAEAEEIDETKTENQLELELFALADAEREISNTLEQTFSDFEHLLQGLGKIYDEKNTILKSLGKSTKNWSSKWSLLARRLKRNTRPI